MCPDSQRKKSSFQRVSLWVQVIDMLPSVSDAGEASQANNGAAWLPAAEGLRLTTADGERGSQYQYCQARSTALNDRIGLISPTEGVAFNSCR
jgi:hypothetical protein